MSYQYQRILNYFYSSCWAIDHTKFEAINAFMCSLLSGEVKSEKVQNISALHDNDMTASGGAQVINIFGLIDQRMNLMMEYSGGTSTELIGERIKSAVDDPKVENIVLNIDSPGGNVFGIQELVAIIHKARKSKKVIAVANSLAASGGFWIGASASEFVVTTGGEVGSIGVITAHQDQSEMENQLGLKTTIISAGKYKSEGNPHEPLEDEALQAIQKRVYEYYGEFVKAVAKGRGVKAGDVREGFGQGRTVGAKEALSLGMVDRIQTFDEVIESLTRQPAGRARNRVNLNRETLEQI